MASIGSQLLNVPVVLRGSASIPAGGPISSPATFNTTKLQNTLRVPIEITEFLVTCRGDYRVGGAQVLNATAGMAVELDLRVGGHHLTNGYVPFSTLAPYTYGDDGGTSLVAAAGIAMMIGKVQRRVVLPSPIRLRPGVGFSGSARRVVPAAVTLAPTGIEVVTISAIGRVVPEGITRPTAQDLPMWTACTLLAPTTAQLVSTFEQDLVNPLAVPLDVHRVISAHASYTAAALAAATGSTDPDPGMTLRWPNGDLINDAPIYLQSAFIRENAITDRFSVPAGSRVNVTLDFTSAVANWQTKIALFGTRKEVL